MEQLKKNGFWVGLAVVAAVIAGGFVYLVVFGEWEARAKAETKLKADNQKLKNILEKPAEIPSQKQIADIKIRTEELRVEVEKCKDWYKGYDAVLDQWFEGLPNPPAIGAFKAQYDTLRDKMKADLESAGIHVGVRPQGGESTLLTPGPAASGGLLWEEVGAPNSPSILEIQKRFWIRKRIVDALLQIQQEAPKAVAAFEEIRFAPGTRATGEEYPGWPYQTFDLPGKYGEVITCGIRVEITNAVIPKFLKLLLETDAPGPKLLTHLRGMRIVPIEALPDRIDEFIKVQAGESQDAAKQKRLDELKKEWAAPRPVRLFVTYDVFDFDGEKLAKPFAPPATAAAE
jgi:hypothetical protein